MSMRPITVSVVIPAYNEEELLPATLAALMPQAIALGAEVIVVDNNSTDATTAVAQAAGARVVHEPRKGVVFAIEAGVAAAHGDVIACTDADTTVGPRWLATICAAFLDAQTVATTGPVIFPRMPIPSLTHWLMPHDLWGANMAFRASALRASGGIREDVNMCFDIMLGKQLLPFGTIRFLRAQSVRTSSRRLQAQPVRQTAMYVLNFLSLAFRRRPATWNFSAIRTPSTELAKKSRRRTFSMGTLAAVLIGAYLLAWPQATVFGQIDVRPHVHTKLVALTFDDGPNGAATRAIADILVQKNVPATFFVVGRSAQEDPATVRYVFDKGFSIQNHSWDHSFELPLMTVGRINKQLADTSSIITSTTGVAPTIFRPPHGLRSPQMLMVAHRLHLRLVDWSVNPQDYFTGDSRVITDRVVHHVRAGSIILLHDGLQDGPKTATLLDRSGTIAALPVIIDTLQQEGYTFVSVDTLRAVSRLDRNQEEQHDAL